MVKGRDDFVIALRSAFFKKKEKQKFSLISLIILSIIVIIFSNFNFKPIQIIKLGINEVIYRSSYISSVPENKIKEIISKIKSHLDLHESYEKELIEIENIDQILALNNFYNEWAVSIHLEPRRVCDSAATSVECNSLQLEPEPSADGD